MVQWAVVTPSVSWPCMSEGNKWVCGYYDRPIDNLTDLLGAKLHPLGTRFCKIITGIKLFDKQVDKRHY